MKQHTWPVLGLVIFAFVILCQNAIPQIDSNGQSIEGFWEGEFMPGNNLTLILTFHQENDGTIGRILLFQASVQIQDDPLTDIKLTKNLLSFVIAAKNTPFSGTVTSDGLHIAGEFEFPDGSVHPVAVNKVARPTLGNFAELTKEPQVSDPLIKYTTDELHDDFKYLRRQLQNIHPQLYLYTAKENFDELFENTLQSINSAKTADDFFRLIAPVVAQARCVHTGIRLADEFLQATSNRKTRLPLDIKYIDNKAYIITDYSHNPAIQAGMQVLSINGMSSSNIWQQLVACIPADGYNQSQKTFVINNNFSSAYSSYIAHCEQFDLECLTSTGEKMSVRVTAQTPGTLEQAIHQRYPEALTHNSLPMIMQIINQSKTARLTVKGFWAPDPEQFMSFLQESFSRLKTENIQNLILDVRGNKGGHPFFAAELLSYLARSEFIYFELPEEQGEFAPLYKPMPYKKDHFTGDIYILMDGGCLSSTGHFLSLVKYHKIATLIGEESGGSFYCNDGSIQVALPNTKIVLNLPQTTFQTAVDGFEKGDPLLPDFEVKPTLADVLNGQDVVLDYALQLIQKK
ncbi:hypothetical protein EH223_03535 [candidate division KSB1 bacterium]|nr:hypothetical protein [candidate division KSB1 bacterium]RQW05895.1 MAG: hypothetical protein EH223_03535 [candidate division KSB1 bacterium]